MRPYKFPNFLKFPTKQPINKLYSKSENAISVEDTADHTDIKKGDAPYAYRSI